jgi:hypothetical protein
VARVYEGKTTWNAFTFRDAQISRVDYFSDRAEALRAVGLEASASDHRPRDTSTPA